MRATVRQLATHWWPRSWSRPGLRLVSMGYRPIAKLMSAFVPSITAAGTMVPPASASVTTDDHPGRSWCRGPARPRCGWPAIPGKLARRMELVSEQALQRALEEADRISDRRKRRFLTEISLHGNVSAAARAIRVSRQHVYLW